jgi:hypothetical protein
MQPSREQALWACVLGQAINDALGRASYNPREYRRDGDPHLEAREWFDANGEDYRMVATLAGLCPDALRHIVLNTPDRIGQIYFGAETRPRRRTAPPEGRAA